MIRLQKFLSNAGVCSRRKAEEFILQGLVRVNGVVVHRLGTKINPDEDKIEFKEKLVFQDPKLIYIALNKPAGYISSCKHGNRKIVIDLVDIPERIYPVGRLDKDSTGLLLLTNDGKLHNTLSHPSFNHEKEYEVSVKKHISDKALKLMADGLMILGKKTRPAKIKRISDKSFFITLKEGKNRQIRRMVTEAGNKVTKLHRIRISNILLKDIIPGTWRYLTDEEIAELLREI